MLSVKDLIARASARIAEISVAELSELLNGAEPPVLIDVREADEFAEGYITGAIHIPRSVIEHDVQSRPDDAGNVHASLADKDRPIAVYCRSGGRSALATAALADSGFTHVVNVAGGIMAWQGEGLPVAHD